MKITADTNVLVRALTSDDARQSAIAREILANADLVALTTPTLCELVWVLTQGYRIEPAEVAKAIRRLLDSANVAVDGACAEAGLCMLDNGGDFADGVIAHEGEWLGAEVFMSFDRKAVKLALAAGTAAKLLA